MKTKILFVLFLALAVCATPACVTHPPGYGTLEVDYQRVWCARQPGGRMEVWLDRHNRADCVTETHVVEIDWDTKWKECREQITRYMKLSDKKPMCLLILKKPLKENPYPLYLRDAFKGDGLDVEIQTITREDL